MSNPTGKHPAPTRGQARYARRDLPAERLAGRTAVPASSRAYGGVASPRPPGSAARVSPTPPPTPGPAAAPPPAVTPPRRPPELPAQAKLTKRRQLPDLSPPRLPVGTGTVVKGRGDHSGKVTAVRVADAATETTQPVRVRRGFVFWRRANRRITVESRSPALWLAEQVATLARRLLIVGKILAAVAVLAAAVAGGRVAVNHVVASPRFALREVRVGPTAHVSRDEIVELSTVVLGDRLLALDTDVIAARLTRHPWILAARVRRELPAALVIDITERHAAGLAVIGGLYLLDEQGHPFKHATLEEADGQVVLTGISRAEYAGLPAASEAAFREALALLRDYQHPDSLATARHAGPQGKIGGGRPPLSEIHIDPRNGFSLFFYEGGAEVRLGRGQVADKLARLDEILAEFGPRGLAAVRVIHLDGPAADRVPIRLAAPLAEDATRPNSIAAPGGTGAKTALARPALR